MSTGPQDDFPAEASIAQGAASLESILCTDELRRRPSRPPDYERENRALVALATAMVDPKSNILQTFAETILEITSPIRPASVCSRRMAGNGSTGRRSLGNGSPTPGPGRRVILGLPETCWIAIARCYSDASNGVILLAAVAPGRGRSA